MWIPEGGQARKEERANEKGSDGKVRIKEESRESLYSVVMWPYAVTVIYEETGRL